MASITGRYFAKISGTGEFADLTSTFPGLTILSMDYFGKSGKAKNIYTASWVNSQEEDVNIPDTVYYDNPDINISFIVRDSTETYVDVLSVHDSFISFIKGNRVTLKSLYSMRMADFVCLEEYAPTSAKLGRAQGYNFMTGTIKMHRVGAVTNV